jgi:hypothetical protein
VPPSGSLGACALLQHGILLDRWRCIGKHVEARALSGQSTLLCVRAWEPHNRNHDSCPVRFEAAQTCRLFTATTDCRWSSLSHFCKRTAQTVCDCISPAPTSNAYLALSFATRRSAALGCWGCSVIADTPAARSLSATCSAYADTATSCSPDPLPSTLSGQTHMSTCTSDPLSCPGLRTALRASTMRSRPAAQPIAASRGPPRLSNSPEYAPPATSAVCDPQRPQDEKTFPLLLGIGAPGKCPRRQSSQTRTRFPSNSRAHAPDSYRASFPPAGSSAKETVCPQRIASQARTETHQWPAPLHQHTWRQKRGEPEYSAQSKRTHSGCNVAWVLRVEDPIHSAAFV